MQVSRGFFELLGVEAGLGRTFLAEEDMDGLDRVVVLACGAVPAAASAIRARSR